VALHPDRCDTESEPRHARPAVWDVTITYDQRGSSVAAGVDSGLSPPKPAPCPDRRGVSRVAHHPPGAGRVHAPPVGPDGTARPSHRPKAPEEQQACSSGTKNCPTRQNRLVSNEACHVCVVSHPWEGQASEKSLAELAGSTWPSGSGLDQEQGCQGVFRPGMISCPPTKKPRGSDLTLAAQAENRRLSSIRLRIEHAIGGVKRDRIGQETIRLLTERVRETRMETGCGLHNFRLQDRPWHYPH
jgi:hypothetical protein